MSYSKGIVFFIDILGSKDRPFEEALMINTLIYNELDKITREQERMNKYREEIIFKKEQFPYEKNAHIILNNLNYANKISVFFSDCAYIIYHLEEADKIVNEDDISNIIYWHLISISKIISFLVGNGFLLRGGISFGEYFFDKTKNILFGPAINEAYRLEQEAMMPRLIFSNELGVKIKKIENHYVIGAKTNNSRHIDLIFKDKIDNRFYLNYLSSFFLSSSLEFDEQKIKFIDYIKESKKKSLKIIRYQNDPKVITKHNWHIWYLETVKKMILKKM